MEIWDIYNFDRQKTGDTVVRGENMLPGRYHLVVHICVFNSRGQMLIQQRQPFKKGFSGLWDITTGGSALQGETGRQAAERELFEEIGLSVKLNDRPNLSVNFTQGFDDFYITHRDVDLKTLNLQYEEVAQIKWASKEEILQMSDDGIFVPYHHSLINLLFDMSLRPWGAHSVDC